MSKYLDLCQMINAPKTLICPRCDETTKTGFDFYNVQRNNPNSVPGYWELNCICDACSADWSVKLEVDCSVQGLPVRDGLELEDRRRQSVCRAMSRAADMVRSKGWKDALNKELGETHWNDDFFRLVGSDAHGLIIDVWLGFRLWGASAFGLTEALNPGFKERVFVEHDVFNNCVREDQMLQVTAVANERSTDDFLAWLRDQQDKETP